MAEHTLTFLFNALFVFCAQSSLRLVSRGGLSERTRSFALSCTCLFCLAVVLNGVVMKFVWSFNFLKKIFWAFVVFRKAFILTLFYFILEMLRVKPRASEVLS